MNKEQLVETLNNIVTSSMVKIDEPLNKYTYTKTGGPADIYISVGNIEDTAKVIKYAKENNVPVTYLGNG